MCFYLFLLFLNHSVYLLASFHWLILLNFVAFILYDIDLLILPSSFLVGFNERGLLTKQPDSCTRHQPDIYNI